MYSKQKDKPTQEYSDRVKVINSICKLHLFLPNDCEDFAEFFGKYESEKLER